MKKLLCQLLFPAVLAGCVREHKEPLPQEQILGTWQLVHLHIDSLCNPIEIFKYNSYYSIEEFESSILTFEEQTCGLVETLQKDTTIYGYTIPIKKDTTICGY